ncbi:MAG TPA: homoserine kinase [Vicinamibacteria bacterium]|nr:homoserine kinase [Vicinamibacteria bacterium]
MALPMDRITAYAPGSASNLGSGFDCLGVAFTGKGDRVTASLRGPSGVRVLAVSDPRIPIDPSRNTAAIAAAAVLRRAESEAGLELAIAKGLPLAGGMGGSAASAVAGAVAANAILRAGLSTDDLLQAALEAEAVVAGRHADNVAPSLLGGAVLVLGLDPLRLSRVRVHSSLALALVSPSYEVETAKARAVLPASIVRADAVAQAAALGGLLLGLERGDPELIRGSMADRIAEPARAPLYPGYPEARAAAFETGALGVAVSGAGPTVLAVAPEPASSAVAAAMVAAYRRLGIEAAAHRARVDDQGARILS